MSSLDDGKTRGQRLKRGLDLAAIAAFVLWFYAPFLTPGLPPGDFGSTVMVSAVEETLVPTPLAAPTWNPALMCGRPTIGFFSPFRLLTLPLSWLEPIPRMKALVVLFHVLSGLFMYALVAGCGGLRPAALLAGLVYPAMPAHVARTGVYGHIQLPMFYALLPLVFLAIFRLRRGDARPVLVLGLVLGLCFVRDAQRTTLLLVTIGLLLFLLAVQELAARFPAAPAELVSGPRARLLGAVVLAGALGVGVDAFELVNGSVGDPYRAGHRVAAQADSYARHSLDNVYSFLDRGGRLGAWLEPHGLDFRSSPSRYVGLSLIALLAYGALRPARLGAQRVRFWLVAALAPLSVWLSFGATPPGAYLGRWLELARAESLPLAARLGLLALIIALLALAWLVYERNASSGRARRRLGAHLAPRPHLTVAPLPWLQRLSFFLRELRNPEWFQIGIVSFAVVFPAALAADAWLRSARSRARAWLGAAVLLGVVLLDLWPHRSFLARDQVGPHEIQELAAVYGRIGEDPAEFRVMGSGTQSMLVDVGYLWHRKPLAWDFREYSAPRATGRLLTAAFGLLAPGGDSDAAAGLAGLANVKYVIDPADDDRALRASRALVLRERSASIDVYENRLVEPYVRAYSESHALVGGSEWKGPLLALALGRAGVGLVEVERLDAALGEQVSVVVADAEAVREGRAPAEARVLGRDPLPVPRPPRARPSLEVSWSRPKPSRIELSIGASSPVLLVVAESFHPWWRARLDGRPLPLYLAQAAFLGSFVPAGEHRIELEFARPKGYWALAGLSLATLLGSALVLLLGRRAPASGPPLIEGP